jgi:hypothetical protein
VPTQNINSSLDHATAFGGFASSKSNLQVMSNPSFGSLNTWFALDELRQLLVTYTNYCVYLQQPRYYQIINLDIYSCALPQDLSYNFQQHYLNYYLHN